uniref:Gamma-glutamylcyclotransferase family protein n=2 Tax=Timema TaxID=61471 RepID=A0A7R9PPQ0_TIMGE|nr:unnamed protein product [Timema genevievae]
MFFNVFVYGTLKTKEPNHHWLTDPKKGKATFIGEAETVKKYPLVIATKYNIPFLLDCQNHGHNVCGEVYKVDEQMLASLDILEDHPSFYQRDIEHVRLMNSTEEENIFKCWIYFLNKFKPEMLSLPHHKNYSSTGDHGLQYLERYQRNSCYDFKQEVHL